MNSRGMMASHEGTKTRRIETRRLRFLFDTKSGATPSSGVEEYWDGDINWVTPEDLGKLEGRYVQDTRRRISEDGYKNCGVSLAPSDSLVLSKRAPIGQVAILSVDATCNQGCFLLTKQNGVDERFYYYALLYLRPLLEILGRGSTFMELSADDLRSVRLPFPEEQTQRLIADYLDRETARIDALVVEKEKMLALLEEKRAALISRAVTRGLDESAPLKPSGLDWLGDIPAHWETPPVYARFEVQLGKMLDEKRIKGTHLAPYLRNVDVQWGTINTSSLPEMDFDDESRIRYSLQPGDILVCEGGEIGRSAIWSGEIAKCYYQKALHRLRPLNVHDDASFFVYVMQTLVSLCVFSAQANAATIQHLPAEKLRIVRYPAPPIHEQREIVSFLNRETAHIKKMTSEITHSIELLKERRAALITAAVTGQIPVEEMRL